MIPSLSLSLYPPLSLSPSLCVCVSVHHQSIYSSTVKLSYEDHSTPVCYLNHHLLLPMSTFCVNGFHCSDQSLIVSLKRGPLLNKPLLNALLFKPWLNVLFILFVCVLVNSQFLKDDIQLIQNVLTT